MRVDDHVITDVLVHDHLPPAILESYGQMTVLLAHSLPLPLNQLNLILSGHVFVTLKLLPVVARLVQAILLLLLKLAIVTLIEA